ncbi:2'-5' RNA ligase family protein [Jiella pacifica]|mgnify:CR=1 FL=1|uniref:2'-5' RNA ligase family protein n=1 Tax=Jiella pacifica TaxID=2696469 RepID=A0A6N9SZN8_9HYPH|nr:2'-5' RNA ligase family protein [Jiella pacifica]NDW04554.1 2'-5' RNA ligase family protein [Jiella pacifica]
MADAPLILTLGLDTASFERLDAMRRRHFPRERNFIPAHLTLFHHLPGEKEEEVAATLRAVTREAAPIPLAVTGLRFLGRGTACEIDAPPLVALRRDLTARWRNDLTRQDAQGFRPHVTIQNKVPGAEARTTFETLRSAFSPFEATGTGLILWHYRGGPWEEAGTFPFGG